MLPGVRLKNKNWKKWETEFQSSHSWECGGLLDLNAFDANLPFKAHARVLFQTKAVGEVDIRAIRKRDKELRRGEFNGELKSGKKVRDKRRDKNITPWICPFWDFSFVHGCFKENT